MSKRTLGLITASAIVGFVPLLVFVIGLNQSYRYYSEWAESQPKTPIQAMRDEPDKVIMDLSVENLKLVQKTIAEELEFRTGKRKG